MKWRYRRSNVHDRDLIDIPNGSICIQVGRQKQNSRSFVEWLELVELEDLHKLAKEAANGDNQGVITHE
jgi:hypothetical protein